MTNRSNLLTIDFPILTKQMANFATSLINITNENPLNYSVEVRASKEPNNEYLQEMLSDIITLQNGHYICEHDLIDDIENHQDLYNEVKKFSDDPDSEYLSDVVETQKADELADFQRELESKLNEITSMIEETLKNDGDTSKTSQRMTILNNIIKVEHSVTAIETSDLI
jgi:hypothetical protein